jgi:HlyD family secretion protein
VGASRGRLRRWLPYAAGLLLIGAIIAGLWPKPVLVEMAEVTRGPLQASVNEEGKTRVSHRYVVSAPVAGQLRRIPFKAGTAVEQGRTVVAIIDPLLPTPLDARARSTAEARRDAAVANLAKVRAAYAFAKNELERFQKLFAEKTVSAQEFESVQLRETAASRDVAAAEGALRQAEAELAEFTAPRAETDVAPREVLAPVSGRILRIFEESARPVNAGMPLLEIGDPTDLEVIVEVLSRDGAVIQPGMAVQFEQWGGGKPLSGVVRLVEPAAFTKVSALGVEEQRVNVVADLITPPAQRGNLGDGFRVEARIITWSDAAALKVPAGALFRQGEDWAAFIVVDGRASLRKVSAGGSSGTETQVLDGLRDGERVIIYPGSRVEEGTRVQPLQIE